MRPIHTLAAAALALCGLGLAIPAEAAPKPGTQAAAHVAAAVAPPAGDIVLVGHRDRDHRWQRDRDHRRHSRHERRGRDWDRHRDRDDSWRHGRHDRSERDRGRHYGWDRGRGHDKHWENKHWKNKHKRWHARRHPRHRYWHGRHVPRNRYVVIHDYRDYYLPRPPRGHFYARIDNDVFLVAAATKSIIDAFVLFDAVGRY